RGPRRVPLFPYTTLFRSRELEVERLGHRLDHEGLREPGHAEQEGVAAREDGREDAVEHLLLADDAAADLSEQVGARGGEPLEERSEEHTSELQSRFDLVC